MNRESVERPAGRSMLIRYPSQGKRMVDRSGDRQVLANLAKYESDLSKPHHITHYLYFKSVAAAQTAADELRHAGYDTRPVDRAPASLWQRLFRPALFSCIAETWAIPSEQAVFAMTDRMEEMAARLGGDYDGWDADIVERRAPGGEG